MSGTTYLTSFVLGGDTLMYYGNLLIGTPPQPISAFIFLNQAPSFADVTCPSSGVNFDTGRCGES